MKEREFALYKGDTFICIGTAKELANRLDVQVRTISYYATNAYKRRLEKRQTVNPIICVDLDAPDEPW
ncbi:hypothetical protein AM500_21485 [Bacillus sp. FJAT-18017]|uniref:hypothetical protein n=1 Tax=Bacillus sp. FJAT-18017 TaxID=1705566 RepID=UPI0006B01E20|nr:hypothetical protein [Bacillus sp. FJAT-18017]ALC92076.1 hypothetical protein AM500_21485 [Bacillus sp. FJAT-18017]